MPKSKLIHSNIVIPRDTILHRINYIVSYLEPSTKTPDFYGIARIGIFSMNTNEHIGEKTYDPAIYSFEQLLEEARKLTKEDIENLATLEQQLANH